MKASKREQVKKPKPPEHITECFYRGCKSKPKERFTGKWWCKRHADKQRRKVDKRKTVHSDIKFLKRKAKELDARPTGAEAVFERKLKELEIEYISQKWFLHGGIKGIYDFYVPKGKFVIEVDGGYHLEEDQKQTDAIKDFIAQQLGFKMIRITNEIAINMTESRLKSLLTIK